MLLDMTRLNTGAHGKLLTKSLLKPSVRLYHFGRQDFRGVPDCAAAHGPALRDGRDGERRGEPARLPQGGRRRRRQHQDLQVWRTHQGKAGEIHLALIRTLGGNFEIRLDLDILLLLIKICQAVDLCAELGLSMTIEDTWGGDINTSAIMHLVISKPCLQVLYIQLS